MKKTLISASIVVAVIAVGFFFLKPARTDAGTTAPRHSRSVVAIHVPPPKPIVTSNNAPPANPAVVDGVKMTYNPFEPSDGPYPILQPGEKIWIDASIDQQLVYLFQGSTRIYTMATSSGMESVSGDGSPLGVYHIQRQRGTWFYVPRYHEGAKYWVSWKGHGIYLFHSVPMDRHRKLLPAIAARLLKEASHGCFHLTVADAKWFYEHVPYGTTVVVERAPVLLEGNTLYHPSVVQQRAIASTRSSNATASVVQPAGSSQS